MNTELPIIDFAADDAPQAFTASLHETGFAVLKNHPLAQTLIEGIYSEWAGFFQTEAKQAYARDPDTHDGYFSPAVSETAKGHHRRDLKEFFHIYPWGRYPAQVSPAALDYYAQASVLAKALLRWVDQHSPAQVRALYSMPLPDMLEGSDHTLLRVLHYPPLLGAEEPDAVRAAGRRAARAPPIE